MAKEIFKNQSANSISDIFVVRGKVQVDVSGVLGGADVITWKVQDNGAKAPIRCCSWRTSLGETIPEGADSGEWEFVCGSIQFEILNAGATTNVSLSFISEF